MPLTVNQRLANEAVKHRLYLSRLGTGQARKLQQKLQKAELEISVELFRIMEKLQPSAARWNMTMLQRVRKEISKVVNSVYGEVWGELTGDLQDIVKYETAYQAKALAAAFPAEVQPVIAINTAPWSQAWASVIAKPFQGQLLSQWGKTLPENLVKKIGNSVQQGVLLGESYTDIIKRVKGTAANNYNDGVVGRVRNTDLANLVKTAVNHTTAVARDATAKANEDIIKARKWLSTLDNHTSPMCIIRDNLYYTMGDIPKPIGHSVPYGAGPGRLHFCCRSTETWVTKSFEEMGLSLKNISPGTRASMNGQVPNDMSYSQWLKTQTYHVLEDVLGVTRAQMVRDGKVNVPDLFSDKGEWLTLDKLKQREIITDS